MLNIKVICIGKLKEKYFTDACGEYRKRLSRFCELEIKELAEAFVPENASAAQIDSALSKEGEQILKEIGDCKSVFALCIEGSALSSTDFAEKISELSLSGESRICFVIGSSHGLCDKVKEKSTFRLSFSKMTFPHQLFRVLLLEQIYRAFMINGGGKYHK